MTVPREPPSTSTDSSMLLGTSSKKPFIIQITKGSWVMT